MLAEVVGIVELKSVCEATEEVVALGKLVDTARRVRGVTWSHGQESVLSTCAILRSNLQIWSCELLLESVLEVVAEETLCSKALDTRNLVRDCSRGLYVAIILLVETRMITCDKRVLVANICTVRHLWVDGWTS